MIIIHDAVLGALAHGGGHDSHPSVPSRRGQPQPNVLLPSSSPPSPTNSATPPTRLYRGPAVVAHGAWSVLVRVMQPAAHSVRQPWT